MVRRSENIATWQLRLVAMFEEKRYQKFVQETNIFQKS